MIANAREHADQKEIVHRDIKPANVLIDACGEPIIAEFGIAATFEEIQTKHAEPLGTPPTCCSTCSRANAASDLCLPVDKGAPLPPTRAFSLRQIDRFASG